MIQDQRLASEKIANRDRDKFRGGTLGRCSGSEANNDEAKLNGNPRRSNVSS
jgi:hypothetical protein